MNLNTKSTLAKLLARENITVQHGNFRTAYFDVNARVLGLPLWKDKGKDVYDLLVGHEVGHALFTPAEGWHDAAVLSDIPKDYLNVVEDIRIEKLIQRQYPGLVACFKRGYKSLSDENFFETSGKDVNTMHFMNRLNLKAKLREYISIDFSAEEQPHVDKAMAVETWEDVIAACRDLHEYMKTLKKQDRVLPTQKPDKPVKVKVTSDDDGEADPTQDSGGGFGDEEDTVEVTVNKRKAASDDKEQQKPKADKDTTEEAAATEAAKSTSGSVDGDPEGPSDSQADSKDKPEAKVSDDTKAAGNGLAVDKNSDIDKIDTDRAFRSNEGQLLDTDKNGKQPLLIRGLNDAQLSDVLIPFKDIKEQRAIKAACYDVDSLKYYDVSEQYREFMSETEKFVAVMSKEFEMRKAAFQYSRSQSARSGSLDVSKLYNYKFSDDIFRRVTRLADSKNHGMIMLVDYSGSMHNVMQQVLKQILTLSMFCKKINIPFDVYGFTNMDPLTDKKPNFVPMMNDIDHRTIAITHQLSSTFSKKDYELAFRQMFNQAYERPARYFGHGPSSGHYDQLGGTPLNEVLTAMPRIIEQFKAKHNVQKTILTVLTDGDAQHMHTETSYEVRCDTQGMAVQLPTGLVKVNKEKELTPMLIEHLRKKCNVVTVGYFLADSRYSFNGAVGRAAKSWDHKIFADARKAIAAQKFVSYENTIGYDKYFVLRVDGKSLDTDTDEFSVADNAKASDIRRAFKKFTTSKKMNRVLASQFAEAIS